MRAVVTGAGGFLGSHLSDRLIADGHEVVGLDNFVTGSELNLAHLRQSRAFQLIRQDVSVYLAVDGPVDAVFHFASPASPVDYLQLPIQTLKVGSLGTHKALGLAKAKGARFFLASTSEVYGDPQVHPQPETWIFASCVSSIRMDRACGPMTGGLFRTSLSRRSAASP
jgi:dTDP-glucose 4,6-dehydratase